MKSPSSFNSLYSLLQRISHDRSNIYNQIEQNINSTSNNPLLSLAKKEIQENLQIFILIALNSFIEKAEKDKNTPLDVEMYAKTLKEQIASGKITGVDIIKFTYDKEASSDASIKGKFNKLFNKKEVSVSFVQTITPEKLPKALRTLCTTESHYVPLNKKAKSTSQEAFNHSK
jgi:hypothetical protein